MNGFKFPKNVGGTEFTNVEVPFTPEEAAKIRKYLDECTGGVNRTARQAGAALTGHHEQTIRQACNQREMDHCRHGKSGHFLIKPEALEAWMARQEIKARRNCPLSYSRQPPRPL